jgi:uncharacterized protein YfdQ (DUF2303 family)
VEIAATLEAKTGVAFKSGVRLQDGERCLSYTEQTTTSAGRDGTLQIPERFTLALRPFDGADPFKVEAFLRFRIREGKLALYYELIRTDKVVEVAFDELMVSLALKLKTTVLRGNR